MQDVRVTIDGREVSVPRGSTILDASRVAGVKIPTLCDHPALKPVGVCRVCLVEVDGQRKLQTACTFPVAEGMVVETDVPAVREARRFILELLLAHHPLDCMTCDKAGGCELQDLAYAYGIKESRFPGRQIPGADPPDENPFFLFDHRKCILCRRCVRACSEINGALAIDIVHRGFDSRVSAVRGGILKDSSCEFCGMCVAVCPTGALIPRSCAGAGRRWEMKKVTTTCPYCGVGCTIDLRIKDDRIVSVSSNWGGESNKGRTCVKGRFGWDFLRHPDRLTTPMIRKDGRLVQAGWDEALDLVADTFVEMARKHGPDALAFLSSAKCTNEENYLVQKLARGLLSTNNVDHCARL